MPVKTPAPGELEPIEKASRDELQALQLQRLQSTLQHAYDHVPHYRRAFDAHGVHPSDCRSLADLAKFPFTAKSDLRANYPFGMFAVPGPTASTCMPSIFDARSSRHIASRVASAICCGVTTVTGR